MPRPLILKVTSHNSKPNHKATGSINIGLLPEKETKSTPDTSELNYTRSQEQHSSFVRSLVSKYESTSPSGLYKYKSKSMGDLNQYKSNSKAKNSQDYDFYKKEDIFTDDEAFEERRQNFQQALRKFQNVSGNAVFEHNVMAETHTIREIARRLLDTPKHDYFWFNQVVALLHQIVNDDTLVFGSNSKTQSISRSVSVESSSNCSEDEHSNVNPIAEDILKVSEMKQMYEEKIEQKSKPILESTKNADATPELRTEKKNNDPTSEQKLKVPLKYFGQSEESDESTLTDSDENHIKNDTIDSNPNDHEQPTETDYGENNNHHNTEINCNLNDEFYEIPILQSIENDETINKIQAMIDTIEDCEKEIDNISVENETEATYLNEILLQVLLALDNLNTSDSEVIVSLRKQAFGFAQNCVKKLKDKVLGNNHV